MTAKLGVLITHGIGWPTPDFADRMIGLLETRLANLGADPADVAWKPVYWSDVVEYRQTELLRDLMREHDLDYVKLRKFVVSALGDAASYVQRLAKQDKDVYTRIHEKVYGYVQALRQDLGGGRPLVVMAHSLGSLIMSNYIWDEQSDEPDQGFGQNAFERMETLCGVVTYGSNIPVFMMPHDPIASFRFPPPDLAGHFPEGTPPDALRAAAKWLNFYDQDDVLGYPLKPLSPSYGEAVSQDIEVNVGGLLSAWNPASHSHYDTDRDFTRPVAELLAGLLALL